MADLEKAFADMNEAQQDMSDIVKEKMAKWAKFDKEMKALSKAKTEKDFNKQKDKCLAALADVLPSMQLQSAAEDNWADKIKAAKAQVQSERKNLAELKAKLTKNAQETEAHNKKVEEFNKTPEGKQKPRKALPVVDPLKATAQRQDTLDRIELEATRQESFIKVGKERVARERQVVDREQKDLEKKKFGSKAGKK